MTNTNISKQTDSEQMKGVIKEIRVYSFDDLEADIQRKVLDKFAAEKEVFLDWLEDSLIKELKEEGFENAEIFYRISYSQGDGASFSGDIDLNHFLKGKFRKLKKYVDYFDVVIRKNDFAYFYPHEKTRFCELSIPMLTDEEEEKIKPFYPLLDELVAHIESKRLELSINCYKYLKEAYEYEISDEVLKDDIAGYGYVFLEDGTIFK